MGGCGMHVGVRHCNGLWSHYIERGGTVCCSLWNMADIWLHPIKAVASNSNILSTSIRLDQPFHMLWVGGHTVHPYMVMPALHFLC